MSSSLKKIFQKKMIFIFFYQHQPDISPVLFNNNNNSASGKCDFNTFRLQYFFSFLPQITASHAVISRLRPEASVKQIST